MGEIKVKLEGEMATLLVPLYGKAMESRKPNPILQDAKAGEIVTSVDFDFSSLKIPAKTNTMMCLRAKLIDNFSDLFIRMNPGCRVLHLGCGLDSRCKRVDTVQTDWYDLDFPEVIDLRQKFYNESENYHMIASSVTEKTWIASLPKREQATLVIAEGLFMYLDETEIRSLFASLMQHLGPFTIIFDAFSTFTAKKVRHHPSLKMAGARVLWGIDDPYEMTRWQEGITFVREIFFTANELIEKLEWQMRIAYKLAHIIPAARRAQRILIFQAGKI